MLYTSVCIKIVMRHCSLDLPLGFLPIYVHWHLKISGQNSTKTCSDNFLQNVKMLFSKTNVVFHCPCSLHVITM